MTKKALCTILGETIHYEKIGHLGVQLPVIVNDVVTAMSIEVSGTNARSWATPFAIRIIPTRTETRNSTT
ncbi:MAG: hypothetical protein F6K24_27685 [Okeania sp. SIO2D1]|nr:hypothetical protein [Okeania sp. SIO2D1]